MTFWAKSDGVAADGIRIVVDDDWGNPAIVLLEGNYDWKEFRGEFFLPGEDELETRSFKIVSAPPGKVWLDDFRVERVE